MREEYDFSRAVIGEYATRYAKGTNVVLLDSDIVRLFPDSKSVNDALRSLVRIADRRAKAEAAGIPRVKRRQLKRAG